MHSHAADSKGTDISTSVAIIGLGKTGLVRLVNAATRGFDVIGYDTDEVKIAQLASRNAHFLTEELNNAFAASENIVLTADENELQNIPIFLLCVPVPLDKERTPDVSYIEKAARTVARHMKEHALVICERSVSPCMCERVVLPILNEVHIPIHFAYAHLFFEEPISMRPLRVIGGMDQESAQQTSTFYGKAEDSDIAVLNSIREAEAASVYERLRKDILTAFVNELAMGFDKAKINLVSAINALKKWDSTQRTLPGPGIGGRGTPDPYLYTRKGHDKSYEHQIASVATRINNQMPSYAVDVLINTLGELRIPLKGSHIALLGLTSKMDNPNMRMSPALDIRSRLIAKGATVASYDPLMLGAPAGTVLEDALAGAQGAIIATDHTAFRDLEPEIFLNAGVRVVIDARNCLNAHEFKARGIAYRGIGSG